MVKDQAMDHNTKAEKRVLSEEADESPSKKLKTNDEKTDRKEDIKQMLGVDMPTDFFSFYDFVHEENLINELENIGLHLTGPFDILNGSLSVDTKLSKAEVNLHGRHFFDIPEVMTVLYAKKNGFHIGYFRDDPKKLPDLVVSNKSEVNGEFSACGDNIFAAVYLYCQEKSKGSKDKKSGGSELLKKIEGKAKELKLSLDAITPGVKKRLKNVNSKTFNKIGLVVPMDKTGVGYRELPETDGKLKQILNKIVKSEGKNTDELDEIVTLVQFANDECDYGMGLELGLDLFAFGDVMFHSNISHLLPLGYQLLGRDLYSEISAAHLEDRKRIGFISKV